MKRILCLIIALATLLCIFVSCGDKNKQCSHSGGKATCTSPAICELCGVAYGEVDEDNHAMEADWKKTDTTHQKVYRCCEATADKKEDHDWYAGICKDCDYTCTHKEGEANCKSGAVCSTCGKAYTEKDVNVHNGEAKWEIKIATHKSVYDCCHTVCVSEELHEWVDGVCSECEYKCSHSGGTATCTSKAICENCGSAYGETDPENHAEDAEWIFGVKTHTKKYNCCGVVELDNETHNIKNGSCVECGSVCYHYGGEATCVNRAVCTVCGVAYGEKNPNNHSGTLEVVEFTSYGHKVQYTCCGVTIEAGHSYKYGGFCEICGLNNYLDDKG